MNKLTLALFLGLAIVAVNATHAQQAIIDFEDIPVGTTFGIGSTITSNSFDITVSGSGGGTRIQNEASANFQSGNSLFNAGNRQLIFQLEEPVQHVSFLFQNSGGTNFLTINGETSDLVFDFADLNGTTLGGVGVSTTGVQQFGELALNGPISGLTVSGQELGLDNIVVGVPEPSSAAVLGMLLGLVIARRRK